MGRPRLPTNILIATGKKHLTKQDIKDRNESEIAMSDGNIICPDYVKKDVAAYKKWREVVKLLKENDLIKPADAGSVARYCLLHSQMVDLISTREQVINLEQFSDNEEREVRNEFEDNRGERAAAKMWQKVEFIFSAQAVLSFEKAINDKMRTMKQIEDALFLNPLARMKNILPKKKETKNKEDEEMFG